MQKSIVFHRLVMNNTKKPIPGTIVSKRIKYLGISLTKKVLDLDVKDYKNFERNWKFK